MTNQDCAKCGACTSVCPVYQVTGRESFAARGQLHLLEKLAAHEQSPDYAQIVGTCLLCGACAQVCPRGLDPPARIIQARQSLPARLKTKTLLPSLARKALADPSWGGPLTKASQLLFDAFLTKLPKHSGLRRKLSFMDLDRWYQNEGHAAEQKNLDSPGKPASVAYFRGCFAKYLHPEISASTRQLLHLTGRPHPLVAREQTCCGLAAHAAGDIEEARTLAQTNMDAFSGNDLPILTSCASCSTHLQSYPALFAENDPLHSQALAFAQRVREFSSFFLPTLQEIAPQLRESSMPPQRTIAYHDPCHLRFRAKVSDAPRQLIHLLPDCTLQEFPNGPSCCGQGGLFDLFHPDLSQKIMQPLFDDFSAIQVDTVTTTCTGCLIQWARTLSAANHSAHVAHLSTLLVSLLGKPMPDKTE